MNLLEDLKTLIQISSFSGEEAQAADWISNRLKQAEIPTERLINNVWAKNLLYDEAKPTVLLNSHLDTVKPSEDWTFDPFSAEVVDNKLIGLGANDAGASLVGLLHTFMNFYNEELPFNLVFCASAEEENSGKNGMELVRDYLVKIDFAVVGEPTNCELAVAEKGLLVIDALATGKSGHAARNNGENAIYIALNDIQRLKLVEFTVPSEMLGKVHLNVTQIEAGTQHNVIPNTCRFTIDVRSTDSYSNEEILNILRGYCSSKLTARSLRLQSSGLPADHLIFSVAKKLGIPCFGSPTLSDQALMLWPSIKTGPGFSERSHTADEFIFLDELEQGKTHYMNLIKALSNENLG